MSDSFRENEAFRAGQGGRGFAGHTQEEYDAWRLGQENASKGGLPAVAAGPGAGLGMVMLIPALLFAPLLLMIGACLFPVAGLLAFVVVGMITGIVGDSYTGFFMLVMAALLPGIVTFLLGLKLEQKLAGQGLYLKIRHGLRIAGFVFLGHMVLMAVLGSGDSAGIYLIHVLLVVASGVAGHFISRRMDGRPHAVATLLGRLTPWRARGS